MKKYLVLTLALLFALTISVPGAFAWGNKIATATATINPSAGGGSSDGTGLVKSAKLPGNPTFLNWNLGEDDGAWASGQSEGIAENKGTAAAGTLIPFKNTTAFAKGGAAAEGTTHAGAFALDIGLERGQLTDTLTNFRIAQADLEPAFR